MQVFRLRLNCIDHYQATPTRYDPQLRKHVHDSQIAKEPKVPVIRVFGSTETGQKVCAHIHGAFPYLYIEYRGSLDKREVGEYICSLHLSIDHALAVSYRRHDENRARPKFVARITLVKAVPFYGFHVGYRFYLKIYMLNPVVMTRLADILQQGLIMGRKFQPYEAHLQYLLQFKIDYNLYGCGYLDSAYVRFRAPVPDFDQDVENSGPTWDRSSIPRDIITEDYGLPRVSHCALEVDLCVQDILNRTAVRERPLHHDFIERQYPLPTDLKLVPSMAGLWEDEAKRRKKRMPVKAPVGSPFPAEALVSMSANPRDSQPPGWLHEEEYHAQIQRLIQDESLADGADLSFSNYLEPDPLGASVKTVFQSVEDLFPDNLLPALGLDDKLLGANLNVVNSSIEVNEKGILELEMDEETRQLFLDDLDDDVTAEAQVIGKAAELKPERKKNLDGAAVENVPDAIGGELKPNKNLTEQYLTSKTEIELMRTVNGFGGFCISGLRSGIRPQIPLYNGLAAEAKAMGLTTKLDGPGHSDTNEVFAAKRQRSELEEGLPPKRQKQDKSVHEPEARNDSRKTEPRKSSQQEELAKPYTTKSDLTRQSGNQTLGFPVVKDAQNPNTKLRLSQQSGSQRSQGDAIEMHVSFDPLISIQEAGSNTENGSTKASASRTSLSNSASTSPASALQLVWNGSTKMFFLGCMPPSRTEVLATMQSNNLPDVTYQDAFYSMDKDVPPRPREYAGREFRLGGKSVPYLPEFDATGQSLATFGIRPEFIPDASKMEFGFSRQRKLCTIKSWEIAELPPTYNEVSIWWTDKQRPRQAKQLGSANQQATQAARPELSQIVGPTPKNKCGFKYSQKRKSTGVEHEAQYMSTMSLEVHVNTRGKLVPNPEEDEVQCIFWSVRSDENSLRSNQLLDNIQAGIIVLTEDESFSKRIQHERSTVEVVQESSELEVMSRIVEIVRSHDPDILTGYEVHGGSWGYLIARARFKYDYDLCDEFSRMKSASNGREGREADKWGFNTTSAIRVTGRHMINIWRAMRGELNLLQYTMENVVWHLLHRRIPHYPWQTLTNWYQSKRPRDLGKVVRHYLTRTRLDLEILEANELIARTSEQARLLGVDFFSVFSRGSQFKVESIMFRIAKPENFILVSPSRKQVGGQNALECLPLVMEPQSAFYNSPLVVLDFQSLYPSVMIAYNYCYSTFLGRIVNWRGSNKMGFAEYQRREGLLRLLEKYINIAPNGVMFTKPQIRKSLLAKMLTEILETRVMVKSGMKEDKDDRTLQRLLNNRQLALKLLANVTYGYTSASFSGRMPCSEIADSIVQTGRETLERAIAFIHSVERWGAEVVYGDTDSLFIYLKGRTREQAFDIGAEIAKEITDMSPRPIKLKFEKVYHPCVLLAKKRYVGYKFESREQTVPEFDAKGIETVRRDGTPAEQKIEEKALKILFETADLSQVKEYFQAQCAKIMRGTVSVQDFCFAREVKLGTYSAKGPGPAGALISTKRMLKDARAEPQYGERVSYVVISGAPGARLIDRCVAPEDLLNSPDASLDAEYYISKNIIPPLERIFNLVGANVRAWYDEIPKVKLVRRVDASVGSAPGGRAGDGASGGVNNTKKKTLEWFLHASSCIVCAVKIKSGPGGAAGSAGTNAANLPICRRCAEDTAKSVLHLQMRLNIEHRKLTDVIKVCQTCAGLSPQEDVLCDSGDCPVFYTRVKQARKFRTESTVVEPLVRQLAEQKIGPPSLDW
ncbi:hypothetical protein B0T24DRAFT_537026 [Lasiosphaeria ovina]|uniref:DNA polymerase n=1 Tax=Lasiosphaeria ovina TaxID=92902 RepID=A0AAE0JWR4_9PEZI|nr:hypothetical protein B0T24DRAFT_537026 [Lasiosphaeria ovina]